MIAPSHVPPARPATAHGVHPLRAGESINPSDFVDLRNTLVLDCCKWDPQVGDISTLATFPLLMNRSSWNELKNLSEALTVELLEAERELLHRPDLHRTLAVPRRLRGAIAQIDRLGATPSPVRTMRFDFHWTSDGWRISEVNSDVPGGFSEGSELPRLMSRHFPGATAPADPGGVWADSMIAAVGGGDVALLAAPGFMEDQQVVSYLARRLQQRGVRSHLADPMRLEWRDRRAYLRNVAVSAIVRFYQAEWLTHLPQRCGWQHLVVDGGTPVTNSASSALTESKRLPLVWDQLKSQMPTWRRLLPETRDPREVPWRRDEGWLLKTAYCNTGDTVTARDLSTPKQWRAAAISACINPGSWIAQRRFEPLAVVSPLGEVYPCIGVYTINGRAAGAYTRLSSRQMIDYRAIDAALLINAEVA